MEESVVTTRKRLAHIATGTGMAFLGLIGLANSWGSMYAAARDHTTGTGLPDIPVNGHPVSIAGASLPLLLDVLIVVASARYVLGVKEGRPVGGYRAVAHLAIGATVVMNAFAARRPEDIAWHVVAPAVLSVVIELVAREILGQLREHRANDRIPLRLWLTAPTESARASWRMARTGLTDAAQARVDTERCAAAQDLLRSIMGPSKARRQILRRLWSGAIDPQTLAVIVDVTAGEKDRRSAVHTLALKSVTGVTHATPESRGLKPTPAPKSTQPVSPATDTHTQSEDAQTTARRPQPRKRPKVANGGRSAKDTTQAINDLLEAEPDLTQVEVARRMGIAVRTVNRRWPEDRRRVAPVREEMTGS
jgi:hypothetical protein